MDRREFIYNAAVGSTSLALAPSLLLNEQKAISSIAPPDPQTGLFTLPKFPHSYGGFEPYIDARTMEIHYTKHHAAYVENLNKAIEKAPDWKGKTVEELLANLSKLPEDIRETVRNHGGGHYNHSFFWEAIQPAKMQQPTMRFYEICNAEFGTFENMMAYFIYQAVNFFGSGWVWLIKHSGDKMAIVSTPNQDNPLMEHAPQKGTPLLAIDLWEHAYYLKHKDERRKYINTFFSIVNWSRLEKIYFGA